MFKTTGALGTDMGSSEEAQAPKRTLRNLAYVGPATAATLEEEGVGADDLLEKAVSYRELVAAGVNPGVAGKLRREHSLRWTHDEERDLDRRSRGVRGLRDGEREWVAAAEDAGEPDRPEDAAASTTGSETTTTASETTTTAGGPGTTARDGETAAVDDRAGAETREGSAAHDDADDPTHASDSPETPPTKTDGDGDPFAAEAAWRERARSPTVATLAPVDRVAADRLAAAGVETIRQLATADLDRLAVELGVPRERVAEWKAAARERAD